MPIDILDIIAIVASIITVLFTVVFSLVDREKLNDIMLWIDEHLNHGGFENLVSWKYWLWENTSHKFCMWICENFEIFSE